jgi:thiamine biosynthesis protein ThiS
MNIIVNGEKRAAETATTVRELVDELKLVPETLLIEHNGSALHRAEWNSRSLREGDRIELVRLAAGG